MPRYMVFIYGDEKQWSAASPEWGEQNAARHGAFAAAAGAAVVDGAELERTASATSLRADADGRLVRAAGPFLQTTEAIGGFYILEAADLEEAVRHAAMIPEATAPHGGVEIRPFAESS